MFFGIGEQRKQLLKEKVNTISEQFINGTARFLLQKERP